MKVKLIFSDNNGYFHDENFTLVDNPISFHWVKKIKHLQKINIDTNETSPYNHHDLQDQHRNFCRIIKIPYEKLDYNNQESLNYLHELYEKNHDYISNMKDNDFLYKFHLAIHLKEGSKFLEDLFIIGWRTKEGPLTTKLNCNEYYAKKIIANNLYLPWSELGKRPKTYFENKEPKSLKRFITLAKPHVTFRARFALAKKDIEVLPLTQNFIEWFEPFKTPWLTYYNIDTWRDIDEYSAVHLAAPDNSYNVAKMLQRYKKFQKIEIIS